MSILEIKRVDRIVRDGPGFFGFFIRTDEGPFCAFAVLLSMSADIDALFSRDGRTEIDYKQFIGKKIIRTEKGSDESIKVVTGYEYTATLVIHFSDGDTVRLVVFEYRDDNLPSIEYCTIGCFPNVVTTTICEWSQSDKDQLTWMSNRLRIAELTMLPDDIHSRIFEFFKHADPCK